MGASITRVKPSLPEAGTILTFDQYMALIEAGYENIELSKGRLIYMSPVSEWHGDVGALITFYLIQYAQLHGGRASIETGVILSAVEKIVRGPDVMFTTKERLTPSLPTFTATVPDLAVEVVSPNDTRSEVSEKVDEYLRYGVRLVWVVEPKERKITVYSADGSVTDVKNGQVLDGGDVLPGFGVPVDQIFSVTDK